VERVLRALAFRFDDGAVAVDQTVANAARIWKLYGTPVRKGDHVPSRPHRLARLLEVPEAVGSGPPVTPVTPVTAEQLEALAATAPREPASDRTGYPPGLGAGFDLDTWLAAHPLDLYEPSAWSGARRWVFRVCPWNPEHRDRSAYLVQFPSGAVAAGCHHNGCAGQDWHSLRDLAEPGWAA
jgi:hypothetical protein